MSLSGAASLGFYEAYFGLKRQYFRTPVTTLGIISDADFSRNGMLGSFLRGWILFPERKKKVVAKVCH